MNGPIAQIVALTCYGNAYLSGRPGPQFFPSNSTCQFCEFVTFVTLSTSFFCRPKETEIAQNPDSWFACLKTCGALGIRLSRAPKNTPGISDRMSAGFVGGGETWTMEVLLPRNKSEFWVARWEVGNPAAADRRGWRVTYGRVSKGRSTPSPTSQLPKAMCELAESLKEIRAFSAKHKLDGFTRCLEEALDTLETQGRNLHGYHEDLAPIGFPSMEAATLLDACQKAWVFGCMGSWNDMGFDGENQKTYDRVSERLFQAVNVAIEQAATSTNKEV